MPDTMMVIGDRTHLTYKVKLRHYTNDCWFTDVYEPYVWKIFFYPILSYRLVYSPEFANYIRVNHPLPEEVRAACERAVAMYEDYKLAWEKERG